MQSRPPKPVLRWLRAGLLLLSVLMAAVLVAGAHFNRKRIEDASELLVRAQVDWILRALTDTFRNSDAPADPELLREVLDDLRAEGLEAVALVEADGSVALAAGRAIAPPRWWGGRSGPVQISRSEGRVIVTARLLVRRARRRPVFEPRADGRRFPPFVSFEFRPLVADRLRNDAERGFLIGIAVATVLVVIASGLWWQLKRRERQAQAQENERRLAQLGEMSAVLAHEIRNPLASLKGQAQLLVEKLPEGRESNKARRIVDEAIRLEALSQTLLDFVRSGRVERQPVDAVELLREAAEAAAPGRVLVSSGGPVERSVMLDPLRIRQALVNLLQNAVQASADAQPIEASVERTERRLRIEIRDHGPGFAPGGEDKIFEAFQTSKTHGTGLGLAIARRIVELHDGTLVGHNHPGGGAVFVLEVPV